MLSPAFRSKLTSLTARTAPAGVRYSMDTLRTDRTGAVENRLGKIEDRITRVESDVFELKVEVKTLNTGLTEFKTEVAKQFGAFRAEIAKEFGAFRADMAKELGAVRVWMLTTGIGTVLAIAAIVGFKALH